MRKIKSLFIGVVALTTVSCSMSARTEAKDTESKKDEVTTKVEAGDVIVLNKADFLTKVFNFEKNPTTWVYEGDKPCIVDFYADWCGPCKQIAPILKELAGVYKDDIIIYKVNVDKEPELKNAFGIEGIPALLFVPREGKPQMSMGALPKAEFVNLIDSFLLGRH